LDLELFAFIYRWALGWLEGVPAKSWTRADGWGGKVFKTAAFCAQKITQVCG